MASQQRFFCLGHPNHDPTPCPAWQRPVHAPSSCCALPGRAHWPAGTWPYSVCYVCSYIWTKTAGESFCLARPAARVLTINPSLFLTEIVPRLAKEMQVSALQCFKRSLLCLLPNHFFGNGYCEIQRMHTQWLLYRYFFKRKLVLISVKHAAFTI